MVSEKKNIIKVLLLGTGESGKSTFFKQMQILYGIDDFSSVELQTFGRYTKKCCRNIAMFIGGSKQI